jgi:hypothetical protein
VVLFELRAEDTRLRGASLLEVSSVLAARAPTMLDVALGLSHSNATPLLTAPSGGGGCPSRGGGRSRPPHIQ